MFLALICFNMLESFYDDIDSIGVKCGSFDGAISKKSFSLKTNHRHGELGLYKGRPIAIGGYYAWGDVETLTEEGWIELESHPR